MQFIQKVFRTSLLAAHWLLEQIIAAKLSHTENCPGTWEIVQTSPGAFMISTKSACVICSIEISSSFMADQLVLLIYSAQSGFRCMRKSYLPCEYWLIWWDCQCWIIHKLSSCMTWEAVFCKVENSCRGPLIAVADNLGRVMVVDSSSCLVICLWKAYRRAQLGWLEKYEKVCVNKDTHT